MLAFIDQIVIPFLNSLYGAVGYLGVMVAMAHRIGDDPAALGADPAVRRLPGLGPDARSSRSPDGAWNFWIVVVVATIGNTLGSLDRRTRSGRTAAGRSSSATGRYLLIRPHEIELADAFFARHGVGDRVHRPAAADRPDLHQLPGRRRPDAAREVHRSTRRSAPSCGRSCSSTRAPSSARTGSTSATRSSRSTWLIAVAVVGLIVAVRLVAARDAGPARAPKPTTQSD